MTARDAPLWARAARDPARPVLAVGAATPVTAGELTERATRIAAGLTTRGTRPGSVLLLAGTDALTTVEAALAGVALGAVVVPARAGARPPAGVCAVVVEQGTVAYEGRVEPYAALSSDGEHDLEGPVAGVVVDLAGASRAVPSGRSVRAAVTLGSLLPDVFALPETGRTVSLLGHQHALALSLLLSLLHSGREVVLSGPTVGDAAAAVTADGVTGVVGTGPVLACLADGPAFGSGRSSGVRRVVAFGGAPPGLRDTLAARAGRDVLVEYVVRDGLETLVAPAARDEAVGGFWSWSAADPAAPAVVTARGTVTAGELRRRVAAAGRLFRGLGGGRVVAAMLPDAEDVVTAHLAAAAAGVGLLVVPPTASDDSAAHLVRTSGAEAVVAADREEAVRRCGGLPVWTLPAPGGDLSPADVEGRAGGVLPSTSGTTGRPKVVVQPRAAVTTVLAAARLRAQSARLGFGGPGRHLVTLPLHHGAALSFAMAALHSGEALVVLDEWSPAAALDLLEREEVTSAFMVPSMFAALLALGDRPRRAPRALRAVVHAAAPCPVEVKRAMHDWWGPVLYDCYAPTELLGTYITPDEWERHQGSVGQPFPGGEVVVAAADGTPCGPGETGYVFLRDQGFGYADGVVPASPLAGFATVGDLGHLDSGGWLYLTGRASDYLSVGGSKFHPSEVEEVLRAVPGVAECAVAGMPHSRLGQVPVAYVVTAAGADAREVCARVLAAARESLPRERAPVRVRPLAGLPRDAYGKLRRGELAALAGGQPVT